MMMVGGVWVNINGAVKEQRDTATQKNMRARKKKKEEKGRASSMMFVRWGKVGGD